MLPEEDIIKCRTAPTADCPNQLAVNPAGITCTPGGEQAVTIDNGNRARADSIDWQAVRRAGWVHLESAQGSTCSENECTGNTRADINVRCSAEGLTSGRHSSIDVTSSATFGQSQRIEVQLTVGCVGDCSGDKTVTVDEILIMVNIALGNAPVSDCFAGDANGDGQITVDEILTAVNNALDGCG